jgi:Uma2 family endonuclease
MSALPDFHDWSVEQYLEYERTATTRHEFMGGQVYAMAGASERHNQIAAAINYSLYGQLLDKPCQVFQSDMRVQANASAFFYPDIVVVCGEAQYRSAARDTLLNPTLIIEILSPSTEDYDRGRKFKHYRGIPSLRDYLLVAQKQMQVEYYSWQKLDTWRLQDFTQPDAQLELQSIGCTLSLAEIYRGVDFQQED